MKKHENNTLPEGLLFSVAGARGIVGQSLDVRVVTQLTLAFCAILPKGPLVIGRDTRPSGQALKYASIAATMASGRDCIDVGIASTPTVEMMVERLGAAGGIIVTASHNPIEWNALKFLNHQGTFISSEENLKLRDVLESGRFALVDAASTGRVKAYAEASQKHIDAICALPFIDVPQIRKRGFKVVLDCINGAGSVIAPPLMDALGAELVCINCKDDGDFNRDPEPRPENLGVIAARVAREHADIGFAADPDADRLAVVDPATGPLSEEYTLAFAVDYMLSRQKSPVVVNMSTSALIDVIASRYGVPVLRTPVGEAHVVDRMLKEGAIVGGEGNGGVILPVLHPGRDALLAMALILQLLADTERSVQEQVATYPPFCIDKKKMKLHGIFSPEAISGLIRQQNPDMIDTQDGVKAIFKDGWYHLRVSNTEGIVRVIAEAATKERMLRLLDDASAVLEASWASA